MDLSLNFIIILVPVILFALTIHEYAHALVAYKLGDDTASLQGRLTLNPLVHLDILGTILIFIVGFGWAKPVPVNPLNFKDPRKDMLKVAIAGPLTNLIIVIISGALLRILIQNPVSLEESSFYYSAYGTLIAIMILNIIYGTVLAVFNMIPIPPLDGSRILYGILPEKSAYKYMELEKYSIFFLFFIFIGIRNFASFNIIQAPVILISKLLTGVEYIDLIRFLNLWIN